jgi:prepilin peptidase CpaA
MRSPSLELVCTIPIVLIVGTAIITDLRWRRIPNSLTFPALAAALIIRIAFQGWLGLGLALSGALIAPIVILLLHFGKGLGMGDLKLAAALGAFFGPVPAIVAMFASAILGGVLALALLMQRGQLLRELLDLFLVGLPFLKRKKSTDLRADASPGVTTMPYGVALGIGSLTTLAGYAWLGASFPTYAQIAARL